MARDRARKGSAKKPKQTKAKTPATAQAEPKKVGRPTDYREEFVEQAYKLCLLGATDIEMADFFEVSEVTLNAWKKEHPEFLKSITKGKIIADAEVADSLRQRALGYSHPEVHVSTHKGEVKLTPLTKHYPPDTQAASLWLRNRQPGKWRDKVDHEHVGAVPVKIVDDIPGE